MPFARRNSLCLSLALGVFFCAFPAHSQQQGTIDKRQVETLVNRAKRTSTELRYGLERFAGNTVAERNGLERVGRLDQELTRLWTDLQGITKPIRVKAQVEATLDAGHAFYRHLQKEPELRSELQNMWRKLKVDLNSLARIYGLPLIGMG